MPAITTPGAAISGVVVKNIVGSSRAGRLGATTSLLRPLVGTPTPKPYMRTMPGATRSAPTRRLVMRNSPIVAGGKAIPTTGQLWPRSS